MLTTSRAARLLLFASALLALLACSDSPSAATPAWQATEAPGPAATPGAEPFTAARPDNGPVSANPPHSMPSMTEVITVPMAPREAVRAAVKLAQWPAIPQFGTLTGEPDAVFGRLLVYREAWKYYSDRAMGGNDLPAADNLVWLVVFEGEIYGKCDQPGCSHLVGPWPDWPERVEEDEWRQSMVVMDAVTGELMTRSVYHEGQLRSTEGLENLTLYLHGSPADGFLGGHGLSHLAENLLFIAHWDWGARAWLVRDVAGGFSPDQLTWHSGVDDYGSAIWGALTGLEPGKEYDFRMRRDQTASLREGETGDRHFMAGRNIIRWPYPQEDAGRFSDARPLPGWELVRVPGWTSYPEFHLHLPPGWEWRELQGLDSYVGEVTGDGIRLTFDYGGFSWTLDPNDDPEHGYAVIHEEIGGLKAKLLISLEDRAGYTGVYFQVRTGRGFNGLNLVGEGLTREQQHTAVSVFRSIRLLPAHSEPSSTEAGVSSTVWRGQDGDGMNTTGGADGSRGIRDIMGSREGT